ncbi:MAG: hypothetical protein ACFFKA_20540 [Candidatus Thorarchaeota archaeon]
MIEEKIMKYRNNLEVARRLARNRFANQEYYEEMSVKLERLLKFYENLRIWNEISDDK